MFRNISINAHQLYTSTKNNLLTQSKALWNKKHVKYIAYGLLGGASLVCMHLAYSRFNGNVPISNKDENDLTTAVIKNLTGLEKAQNSITTVLSPIPSPTPSSIPSSNTQSETSITASPKDQNNAPNDQLLPVTNEFEKLKEMCLTSAEKCCNAAIALQTEAGRSPALREKKAKYDQALQLFSLCENTEYSRCCVGGKAKIGAINLKLEREIEIADQVEKETERQKLILERIRKFSQS